ncbi:DUF445 domain-containing protein [Phreatobacter oligotrophus]|uniref:Uncharacterized membrane-anchored protein YjiN (DUF445 family) n=1 Tax=Phreatobacter oligotrophus TaxID=1122261 RepID=A0A2T4Z2F5_9HYPH|nr:DUF445 family protein [Phreatobacter oligotrophus]PTM54931.1 uncharacterized membrane-anchored protein YjiN (DUF445 family) [Phreatobacter oligotrophus]
MAPEQTADTEAAQREREKQAALTRAKRMATLLLLTSITVMVIAKALEHRHPAFGFIAAFAEAATIGGLADWYAVVALFRHPMGLPIPHTAIIQKNQSRIADSLGKFVETNFLAPGPVGAKLREVDFASMIAAWLADPAKSASLSRFVVNLLPQAVAGMDQSRMKEFLAERLTDQLSALKLGPLGAKLLGAITEDRRHQRLLDEVIDAVERILADQATIDGIRDKIRQELPTLFNLFKADAYLLGRILKSTGSFLDEVRTDPDHALRLEFDRFVENFIVSLRESPDYEARAEKLKQDILGRQEVRDLAQTLWRNLVDYVERDASSPDSRIEAQVTLILSHVGEKLATDPRLKAEMNDGFVVTLSTLVEQQKSGASRFIADQVKAWNMQQLIRLIELNVGRDLQYIRLNGTLIGGLAGLVLHTIEVLIRAS